MKNTIGTVKGHAGVLHDDPWSLMDDEALDKNDDQNSRYQILSLESLFALEETQENQQRPYGVILHPDDDPEVLLPWLDSLTLIALQFPRFSDGRAYTQAYLLRGRYGYKNDLRAVGDVLRDQLAAMRHCGFTSFAVREDKPLTDALKGLNGFDMIYARSVTHPEPLFRRRHLRL
ncbi:DUF934 domain-containing protein [Amphritea sp.]|uniref:DUF934 domain-containing protein n=1 Tax=Amphritea sp. TaxID=1872502 RepID=UPI0025B95900|nr:DUF934 domain-containing protein [Amphritea sp.]